MLGNFFDSFILITADIVIFLIILLSFVFGWLRGITKEVLSIIAWIGGIFLAFALFPYTKEFTRSYIEHGLIADFVTVCGLFVLFLTVISIVNYFCSNFIKKTALNVTDKALGAIFGIARGVIIVAVLDLVVVQCMLNTPPKWVEDSKLRPMINSVSDFIILIMPDSIQTKILSHVNNIKKQSLLSFIQNGVLPNAEDEQSSNVIIAQNSDKPVEEEAEEFIDEPDTPQTAEELSTLKPKKVQVEKKSKERNSKERNDMDRLLDQYKNDE